MSFKQTLIGTASALALLGFNGAALAQGTPVTTTQPSPTDANASQPDDIVVNGYRESVAKSLEVKRNLSVVGDIISAEDIGKFPDRNVAEALQRVPGIVINREFGEGERVSLRGTAPNLTKTLLNGHAVATADWFILEQLSATRSFNYLTLPADIVGQLDVYKSPQADVEEGGIGGTINVHTRNPLDLKSLEVSGSLQAVYSDLSDKVNPQGSALVSWHNQAGTFGILVGGVYQRRETRRDGVETLGYFTPIGASTGDAQVPSLIGSTLFQQNRERYGGNIGIQFKPTDTLEINVTGLYSRFNANNLNENYLAWGANALGGGGTLTNATVKNGTVVSGTITSTPTGRAVVYDAIERKAYAETWSGDFDAVWKPSDTATLHFKAGYTEAHGNTASQPFYEGGAPGSFTYDLTGFVPQVKFTGVDPTKPNDLIFDFASLNKVTNLDKETYAYVDYEQALDMGPLTAIKIGGKFTDHDRVTAYLGTTYGSFYLPLAGSGCDGGPCTSADFAGELTPGNFLNTIALPGTLSSYFQVDPKKLSDLLNAVPGATENRLINPPYNFSINEKTYGGYGMAKFGGDRWKGNVGVRVISTKQHTEGNIVGTGGPGSVTNAFGNFTPSVDTRTYTDVLPSINLSYDVMPNLVARFAAGRTMARPDYTDIVPAVSLNPGSLTGTGGDPSVKPYRANQYDLSIEWYPDRDTIVAAAFYYKDIQSYIVNTTTTEIFPVQTSTPNLSLCTTTPTTVPDNLYNCTFEINRRSNGSGGRNEGVELQVSRPIWGGFGAILNYTYSNAKADNGDPIPGNSKHAVNVTGYYEKGPVSARLSYNYRSAFFINIDRATPLNQGATQSLDASASLQLNRQISLTFDAINLTDDKIEQYAGTRDRPRAIYDNGRQYYFGARFRY